MIELTCPQCEQLAPELALKMLSDCQRARVLAHLAGCSSCRDTVSALTTIADQIIELLPKVQPPAGFEQRVITALANSATNDMHKDAGGGHQVPGKPRGAAGQPDLRLAH
jgi:hypothetical protein